MPDLLINADPIDVRHYINTIALTATSIVDGRRHALPPPDDLAKAEWLEAGQTKRAEWDRLLARQTSSPHSACG